MTDFDFLNLKCILGVFGPFLEVVYKAMKVKRPGHLDYLLVTISSSQYVVRYYKDNESEGKYLTQAVDALGLYWIVAAFVRGAFA